MCTKYNVCGHRHQAKWKMSKIKRNSKGRFVQGKRTLTKIFLGVVFLGAVSLIGWNTILGTVGKAFEVENTKAETVIDFKSVVNGLLKNAGLDVPLLDRMIQRESWWNQNNSHLNKDGTLDRGLWMLNDKYHAEVSDECAYDYYCSTVAAIKILKQRGYKEWVSYQYEK